MNPRYAAAEGSTSVSVGRERGRDGHSAVEDGLEAAERVDVVVRRPEAVTSERLEGGV